MKLLLRSGKMAVKGTSDQSIKPDGAGASSLSVPPEYGILGMLRQFVIEQARSFGLSDHAIDSLTLAVDEAATNIIEHAVRGMPHAITCTCRRDEPSATVLCQLDYDSPHPFTLEEPPKKAAIHERVRSLTPGGLGVYLVHTLVDAVEYGRSGEKNVILLKMRLDNS